MHLTPFSYFGASVLPFAEKREAGEAVFWKVLNSALLLPLAECLSSTDVRKQWAYRFSTKLLRNFHRENYRGIDVIEPFIFTLSPYIILFSLLTKNCHSPSSSVRMQSLASVAADLQHPLKEVQGGDQEPGTLLQEKLEEEAFG